MFLCDFDLKEKSFVNHLVISVPDCKNLIETNPNSAPPICAAQSG
jgi:hypothetical protein